MLVDLAIFYPPHPVRVGVVVFPLNAPMIRKTTPTAMPAMMTAMMIFRINVFCGFDGGISSALTPIT